MRRNSLTKQISGIFSCLTIFIGLVFIFIYYSSVKNSAYSRVRENLEIYYLLIENHLNAGEFPYYGNANYPINDLVNFIYLESGTVLYISEQSDVARIDINIFISDLKNENNGLSNLGTINNPTVNRYNLKILEMQIKREPVLYLFAISALNPDNLIILYATPLTALNSLRNVTVLVMCLLIMFVTLGNIILNFWTRITVRRIRRIDTYIKDLPGLRYSRPLDIYGSDELTELMGSIEGLRTEIYNNEKNKQEMLQNISHDIKTPIAVIKSYAEALKDGIADEDDAHVIVKQTEILNNKVSQLLQFNKLNYIKENSSFESVNIKNILLELTDDLKFLNQSVEINCECDDSTLMGVKENYFVLYGNILENAVRYAKTKINVTLKKGVVTIFNDGPPISEYFVENLFKPYEKGNKGQFGLGMSIVQQICEHFDLTLKVKNIAHEGVAFIVSLARDYKVGTND